MYNDGDKLASGICRGLEHSGGDVEPLLPFDLYVETIRPFEYVAPTVLRPTVACSNSVGPTRIP